MQVPGIYGRNHFQLIGNRQGTRLFGRKDMALAKALLDLARAIFAVTNRVRALERKGADCERERIMRDLHDDVLPKLITIKHQSPTQAIEKLADTAFQSIRETIYILRNSLHRPLDEAMADWRAETGERLAVTPIKVQWHAPESVDGRNLNPRQFLNCGRILREAISNIIQHAEADEIKIRFRLIGECLEMSVIDNGNGSHPDRLNGVGTNNMRLRARSTRGEISWLQNRDNVFGQKTGMTVIFSFPPDGRGIDFIAKIKKDKPGLFCVIVTAFDDNADIFAALKAGADGYLLKGQDKDRLVRSLQDIMAGAPPLSPSVARRIIKYFKGFDDILCNQTKCFLYFFEFFNGKF